ncbi:DUF4760 domain-containing protein [Acinetobacter guillouiae]|uniref:DUF4760 domain-containing protein n=1 Tax=Acinetobacter guillouiae TaxID=106649 RepID=UPI002E246993
MEIDNILLLRTLLLALPFIVLYCYFFYFIKDDFFLKPRNYIQLNIIMFSLVIAFMLTVYWNLSLREYSFVGFALGSEEHNSSNVILILLGTLAAVLGWLFTSRGQDLNSRRSHSIQTLMSSRLSEAYANHSNFATGVYTKLKDKHGDHYILTIEDFESLEQLERNAIIYQLNYFEFIAVGIRYGDLDENLIKNTLKTIIYTNVTFFGKIIADKRTKSPTIYEHLTSLNKRWNS